MNNLRRAQTLLYQVLFLQILGSAFCFGAGAPGERQKPNIVVIMADDMGWMDVHCNGNKQLDTPAIDQLAKQGMRFTDAYAAAPVCSPTRAAMMTGQAPARLLITNHAPGHKKGFSLEGSDLQEAKTVRNLGLSYVTIAETLSEAGYATAHVGKWHLSYVDRKNKSETNELDLRPEHQGFDVNIGGCFRGGPPSYFAPYRIPSLKAKKEAEYLPERLCDEAIAFVNENRDRPFFLSWWPYSVHYPMQAREKLIAKYRPRKGPGIKDPVYAAMIEAMDTEIGRFLKALDELGLRDNTLVIFKSDNGGYNGDNRPLRGFKGMLYEGGIRIPWIIRWPGKVRAGTTCSTPVISTDVYPTILEVLALEPTPNQPIDGKSLVPLLIESGEFERDTIYFHYPNYAFHKKNRLGGAVREGKYKLIKRYGDGELELFDLEDDIGEKENLANRLPAVARRLEIKLENWLRETRAEMPVRASSMSDQIPGIFKNLKTSSQVLIAAHRGGYTNDKADKAPENSVANIQVCESKGYQMYETDIQRTKDGEFVIVHDATIDRETSGTGKVSEMNFAEIRNLKKKYRDGSQSEESVATLREFLREGKGRTVFKADLKPGVSKYFEGIYGLLVEQNALSEIVFRVPYKEADLFAHYRTKGLLNHEGFYKRHLLMFKVSSKKQIDDIKARFDSTTIQINLSKPDPSNDKSLELIRYATAKGFLVETHAEGNAHDWENLIDAGVKIFHTAKPSEVKKHLQSRPK